MIFIYLQALNVNKKMQVPFRITIGFESEAEEAVSFDFQPQMAIPLKTYKAYRVDKTAVQSSPPFCDIADELVDVFLDHRLVCIESTQFYLIKHLFKNIGYNFNVKPKFLIYPAKHKEDAITKLLGTTKLEWDVNSSEFAKNVVVQMANFFYGKSQILRELKTTLSKSLQFDLSTYKMAPGVYFFLNASNEVLYVGKAKNIRKRLQSHFSGDTKGSNVNYSEVKSITVDYTGNDIIAQLIESEHIKKLKPLYNTQQVINPKPYVIGKGKTASGIVKLTITKKSVEDHLSERYFNRNSVKDALETFCEDDDLCRKHCGIERTKNPCSKVTLENKTCVCNGVEAIETYNKRFEIALYQFEHIKVRKLYKLKGRTKNEDAFVYSVNGIYEGYGYIDKYEPMLSVNDILGHLVPQENNYDTSRILSKLDESVSPEHVILLDF